MPEPDPRLGRGIAYPPSRAVVWGDVPDDMTELLDWVREHQGVLATGGDLSFRYHQSTPATVWTIHHNLGKYPNVQVYDNSGDPCFGLFEFVSLDTVRIVFSSGVAGTAYCS